MLTFLDIKNKNFFLEKGVPQQVEKKNNKQISLSKSQTINEHIW